MNKLNKHWNTTSIFTSEFPILYIRFPPNKFLKVPDSSTDFCFDGGKNDYTTVKSYGVVCVKNNKNNVTCLNK